VRRLYSTFAHGPPGLGLLLMRLVSGIVLIEEAVQLLLGRPSIGATAVAWTTLGLGSLLIVGLWTPIVGAMIAADALWMAFVSPTPLRWTLLATLGAGLALLGPGAWSLDARRFGWRRLDIRNGNHKNDDAPP